MNLNFDLFLFEKHRFSLPNTLSNYPQTTYAETCVIGRGDVDGIVGIE